MKLFLLVTVVLGIGVLLPAATPAPTDPEGLTQVEIASDTTEIRNTIEQFHAAMSAADSAAVAGILADNVRIVEGGSIESKMEYLSHHFHSDAAYMSAMSREPKTTKISESGGTAWVTSITRVHGTYRDREIDSTSAESVVLRKTDGGWKIVAIHWSSAR